MDIVSQGKAFVAEERYRIALHDLVAGETVKARGSLAADKFPAGSPGWSKEELSDRIGRYESTLGNLVRLQALLGYWGGPANRTTIALAPRCLAGNLSPEGGLVVWTGLRWYPILVLIYAGGVAAVAASRYENLVPLLQAPVADPAKLRGRASLVRGVVGGLAEAGGAFKELPGMERRYTPLSDHLLDILRPMFEDLLLIDADYEAAFEEFEVLMSLEHAEQAGAAGSSGWAPIGRFAWKFAPGDGASPFHRVVADAKHQGGRWPPVEAGLFQGSIDRFVKVAEEVELQIRRVGRY